MRVSTFKYAMATFFHIRSSSSIIKHLIFDVTGLQSELLTASLNKPHKKQTSTHLMKFNIGFFFQTVNERHPNTFTEHVSSSGEAFGLCSV
jgi:hypothetical protein